MVAALFELLLALLVELPELLFDSDEPFDAEVEVSDLLSVLVPEAAEPAVLPARESLR